MNDIICPHCDRKFDSSCLDCDDGWNSEGDQVWFTLSGYCPHCGGNVAVDRIYRLMTDDVYIPVEFE